MQYCTIFPNRPKSNQLFKLIENNFTSFEVGETENEFFEKLCKQQLCEVQKFTIKAVERCRWMIKFKLFLLQYCRKISITLCQKRWRLFKMSLTIFFESGPHSRNDIVCFRNDCNLGSVAARTVQCNVRTRKARVHTAVWRCPGPVSRRLFGDGRLRRRPLPSSYE